jgi:two-component system LytT family response regulator
VIKLIIADDADAVRDSLSDLVNSYCPNAKLVACTDSVLSTIKAIKEHEPDAILLDVEMKDGTGFDVLKYFQSPSFKVIFVTAYSQYALEAFNFSALDYLMKPVDGEKLSKAITKAIDAVDTQRLATKIDAFLHNLVPDSKKKIILKTTENVHVVNVSDIVYCEADHSYTNFFLVDGTRIMVSITLGDYEEMLQSHKFIRIHQSFLVNINYLKTFNKVDNTALLSTGKSLSVSARKRDHLLQILGSL